MSGRGSGQSLQSGGHLLRGEVGLTGGAVVVRSHTGSQLGLGVDLGLSLDQLTVVVRNNDDHTVLVGDLVGSLGVGEPSAAVGADPVLVVSVLGTGALDGGNVDQLGMVAALGVGGGDIQRVRTGNRNNIDRFVGLDGGVTRALLHEDGGAFLQIVDVGRDGMTGYSRV